MGGLHQATKCRITCQRKSPDFIRAQQKEAAGLQAGQTSRFPPGTDLIASWLHRTWIHRTRIHRTRIHRTRIHITTAAHKDRTRESVMRQKPRPAGLRPHRSPRLRRPQRHPPPPLRPLPARARHHLRGVLLHENHHQRRPRPSGSGCSAAAGGGPGPGPRPFRVRLPNELLGPGAAGTSAVL